jgi:hypothetical protein
MRDRKYLLKANQMSFNIFKIDRRGCLISFRDMIFNNKDIWARLWNLRPGDLIILKKDWVVSFTPIYKIYIVNQQFFLKNN